MATAAATGNITPEMPVCVRYEPWLTKIANVHYQVVSPCLCRDDATGQGQCDDRGPVAARGERSVHHGDPRRVTPE